MILSKPEISSHTALVILGHGSSKHPGSSRACRRHAETIRNSGRYASVHCGFLKEEPSIETALEEAKQTAAEQIHIAPYFLAEGYFTRTVIPQRLELDEQPSHVHYLPPLGIHQDLPPLLLEIATAHLGDWKAEETSLVLIGHGSNKSTKSKDSLMRHIKAMQQTSPFAQLTDLWLEEPPLLSDWQACVTHQQVLFLPYLLSEGQHSDWDIPEIIAKHPTTSTPQYQITPALGLNPKLADFF